MEETFQSQTLAEHLTDLRRALVRSLIAVGVFFVGTYSFAEPIGHWFFAPLFAALPSESTLIFTSYQEGFFFI
ncbi:twin-arginine translocase subunit TatC [Desulfurivibrio alkaliphilus]|nr:twin-arginine translocase subunit TatC [Desulfurivibrio alkaliphilus]MDF1615163.1 twin-arginine translocase subunit TatC [Desulfurivibrio alkaliphilus]